jgi:hypothetical protein
MKFHWNFTFHWRLFKLRFEENHHLNSSLCFLIFFLLCCRYMTEQLIPTYLKPLVQYLDDPDLAVQICAGEDLAILTSLLNTLNSQCPNSEIDTKTRRRHRDNVSQCYIDHTSEGSSEYQVLFLLVWSDRSENVISIQYKKWEKSCLFSKTLDSLRSFISNKIEFFWELIVCYLSSRTRTFCLFVCLFVCGIEKERIIQIIFCFSKWTTFFQLVMWNKEK